MTITKTVVLDHRPDGDYIRLEVWTHFLGRWNIYTKEFDAATADQEMLLKWKRGQVKLTFSRRRYMFGHAFTIRKRL